MSKLAPSSIKYLIRAQIKAKGIIEKPDVIGAIFGQTEGILGSELSLRELQKTGKIGRIEVNIKSNKGNSEGEIIIPSSLNSSETSLIAATLETIERVGPCKADIKLNKVEDAMESKRQYVMDKAKIILKQLESAVDKDEIGENLKESVRKEEITTYKGLPAGPDIENSESIIIVEGRADVLKLLKYGIKNVIAVGGTSIPKPIQELSKVKEVTVLVDGDRGGNLIVKELLQVADIDFISQVPDGKEVEESTQKEIFKALRDKVKPKDFKPCKVSKTSKKPETEKKIYERKPIGRYESRSKERRSVRRIRLKTEQKDLFKKTLHDIVGTRAAFIFNNKNELLGKVPIKELFNTIKVIEDPYSVVLDGKIDHEIESVIRKKNTIKFLVGKEKEEINSPINIISKADLK